MFESSPSDLARISRTQLWRVACIFTIQRHGEAVTCVPTPLANHLGIGQLRLSNGFHVGGRKVATNTKHSADVGQSERVDLASRDAIALRAYALFEERGREPGRDIDDWLRAEHELREPRQLSQS